MPSGRRARIGASLPWAAYSWGFETIMASLQSVFGLLGAPLFAMAMDAERRLKLKPQNLLLNLPLSQPQ